MAASIVYLGPLTSKDWALLWMKLSDKLASEFSIEVSKHWHLENENDNAKIFKKILKSMGHSALLFNLSHLFNECVFSEYLVSYLLSPWTPYVFDAMGYTKDFMEEELMLTQP